MAIDCENLGLEEIDSLRREIEERQARNVKKLLKAARKRQAEYDALAPALEKAREKAIEAALRLRELREREATLVRELPHAELARDEEKLTALKADYGALTGHLDKAEKALVKARCEVEAAAYDELEETKSLEEDLGSLLDKTGINWRAIMSSPREWPEEVLEIANKLLNPARSRRERLEREKRIAARKAS